MMNQLQLFRYRCVLAVVLLINFIPYILYKNIKSNKLPDRHERTSDFAMPITSPIDVIALQNGTRPPKQIHMHFYNPPSWIHEFKGCLKNCTMSFGKGQDYFNKDVVLFYGPTLWALPVVEKRRGQIWVLYGRKPPPYYKPLYRWNKLFNWTMTYRRDSDFLAVYGQFHPIPKPFNRLPKTTQNVNDVFDPTKYVLSSVNEHATAWFVSHCRTQSKREDYVKTLKKTHYVDIYGACGTLQCDESDRLQCLSSLKQKYKFYLSFENSLCRDYITEKSFDIYSNMLDVVPVTRGFCGIYSMYLPPGSFIDTSYYNDIDQLGHFLNYLSRNKTSYLRYFQWRKHYQVQYPDPFCELCDRMHEPNMTTKYYRLYLDIHRWFLGSPNASMCTKPRI